MNNLSIFVDRVFWAMVAIGFALFLFSMYADHIGLK